MFKKVSIKGKLFLFGLLAVVGLAVVGGESIYSQVDFNKRFTETNTIAEIYQTMLGAQLAHIELLNDAADSIDGAPIKESNTTHENCILGSWLASEQRKIGEQYTPGTDKLYNSLYEPHKQFHQYSDEVKKLIKQGEIEQASQMYASKFKPASVQVIGTLHEIRDLLREDVNGIKEAAIAATATSRNVSIAIVVMTAILIFGICIKFASSLSKPISKVSSILAGMCKGDIEIPKLEVKTQDEVGKMIESVNEFVANFQNLILYLNGVGKGVLHPLLPVQGSKDKIGSTVNEMVMNLRDLASNTKTVSEQVAIGSSQVNTASQSLSQGATEQASALEEISATISEMTSEVRNNSEQAAQASQLAASARQEAEEGKSQLQTTLKTMEEINTSSQKIEKIIKVIDDIAFQTNILALNASVEAARAGQHGKGFAVVAEEVRTLAARSTASARETAQLIEESKNNVSKGVEESEKTSELFNNIAEGTVKVAEIVEGIAKSSYEQANGFAQLSEAVNQIDKVTQMNTANAEETAAASHELANRAEQLRGVTEVFVLGEDDERKQTHYSEEESSEVVIQMDFDDKTSKHKKAA